MDDIGDEDGKPAKKGMKRGGWIYKHEESKLVKGS